MNDRFHHLYITPSDFEGSLAFYRDVLGWSVTETSGGNGNGRVAALSGGGVKVVLAERPSQAAGNGDGAAIPKVHLDIHNIDARFRALPKGEHVVVEPESTQWGTRWFVVRDPDGNLIAFEEVHRRNG